MRNVPEVPVSRVEVITSVQRRRRWSAAEKFRLVEEASQAGRERVFVACRALIGLSQLFAWKRRMAEGSQAAVAADGDEVGASQVRDLSRGRFVNWGACSARRRWRSRSSGKRSTGAGKKATLPCLRRRTLPDDSLGSSSASVLKQPAQCPVNGTHSSKKNGEAHWGAPPA
jgi:transposase